MNALQRAILTAEEYERRRRVAESGFGVSAADLYKINDLLHRAQVYATIAIAQELRAANNTNPKLVSVPEDYQP
jgi:hypothetical protein